MGRSGGGREDAPAAYQCLRLLVGATGRDQGFCLCDMLPPGCCSTAQTAAGAYGQGAFGAAQGATTAGGGVYAQQHAGDGYASQPQQQAQAQVIAGGGGEMQAQSAGGPSGLPAAIVLLHCCGLWAIDWRCMWHSIVSCWLLRRQHPAGASNPNPQLIRALSSACSYSCCTLPGGIWPGRRATAGRRVRAAGGGGCRGRSSVWQAGGDLGHLRKHSRCRPRSLHSLWRWRSGCQQSLWQCTGRRLCLTGVAGGRGLGEEWGMWAECIVKGGATLTAGKCISAWLTQAAFFQRACTADLAWCGVVWRGVAWRGVACRHSRGSSSRRWRARHMPPPPPMVGDP